MFRDQGTRKAALFYCFILLYLTNLLSIQCCILQLSGTLQTQWKSKKVDRMLSRFVSSKEAIGSALQTIIPPPAGSVAAAVVEVASWAVQAVFNKQNCCLLAKKCCDMLNVVIANKDTLESKTTVRESLMKLLEAVNEVLEFIREFAKKGWLKKVLKWNVDNANFEMLAKNIQESQANTSWYLQVETTASVFKLTQADEELARLLQESGGVQSLLASNEDFDEFKSEFATVGCTFPQQL